MNNSIHRTPGRGRLAATSLPMLLIFGGLLLWPTVRADGQIPFYILPITDQSVLTNTPITPIQVSISDPTIPTGALNYYLYPGRTDTDATNATISTLGLIQWTPTQAQVVTFTVTVRDTRTGGYQTNTTFTVTVTENTPFETGPYLLPISDQTAAAGALLTFTAFATNTDSSANPLTFSLDSNSLALGATITAGTPTNGGYAGVFAWTPTPEQHGNYTMTVTVSEQNTSLGATQSFGVNVTLTNNCAQYDEFVAAVAGGSVTLTDCTTIVVSEPIIITNEVTIVGGLTNLTITGNNLTRLFTVRSGGSLTLNNLILTGGLSTSGGAIQIHSGGTCVLDNCILAGNSAVGTTGTSGVNGADDTNYGRNGTGGWPGTAGVGGALFNQGQLEAYDCQFTNNSAMGGAGGNGGNGGSGNYQAGNGGNASWGAPAYGGAIYNLGKLILTNGVFYGNTATGGNGGVGGTAGTNGAFSGYQGSGGAGADAAGGAVFSFTPLSIESCIFSSNAAQGGTSQPGGEAGGGYGVNGAKGGNSFGGAVCLANGGGLADSSFLTNTATGGNGGNGGSGRYNGGSGGDGGSAFEGCLYSLGPVAIVSCIFNGCGTIAGTNGLGGGGPFAGRNGSLGSRLSDIFTNSANRVSTSSLGFAASLPGGAAPALLDPASYLVADGSGGAAPSVASGTQPQAGAPADSAAAAKAAALATNSPVAASPAPGAGAVTPPGVISPGLPTNQVDRATVPGNPAAPPAPKAGATNGPGDEPIPEGMIDFRGADLNQVLDIYSMLVNRTILRPASLPAPAVVLKTQGRLTVREGIQALDAVLGLNGITMVNVGEKFVKAVLEAQGNTAGAAFNTNKASDLPELGQYVTHVVQLKYAKPSEMVPVLQGFIKIPNAILPIDGCQILVLRDYAENVKRMLELVERIDVAIPSEYVQEVIAIKYAKASEIAGALNSLSSGGGGASVGGGGTTGRSTGSRMGGMGRTGTTSGFPGTSTPGMVTPPGSAAPPGAAGTTPGASSFTQRLQNIINKASSSGEIQVLGQTKIISDERTNSLLIFASKEDMKTIKDIVSKLDVVLAQVLIEAVVISVTLTDSRDLAVSYLQHPQSSGKWTGVGALNNNNLLSAANYAVTGTTNASGSIAGGFSYLTSLGQDLDVALTAAAADSRAKILQRPRIQTSHNEPASLFVGESRPYPTSSYYGGGAYGGYSSIQQLQIGVTLEVTPLINPDGLVVMDIHQKIDSFEGNVTIQNVGDVPVTSSKEAQTKVSVRDHDTIIMGGLIETDKNSSKSGVPFLMDLPLLGNLFRTSSRSETRSELVILIRPTVLPPPEIAALTATAEKNKMPGVRSTEREIRGEEAKRLKQADVLDDKKN